MEDVTRMNADEYVQQGQTLLGAAKIEDALSYFDKALEENPMHYDAHVSKGIAYLMQGATGTARECFERAVMVDKTFPSAYFYLGDADLLEGMPEQGILHYNTAISYGYENADVYFNLALLHEQLGAGDDAMKNINKAISLEELNARYRSKKAALQITMGKYAEAIQTCEELRRLVPDSFESFHLASTAYAAMGNYEAADRLLAFAEEAFPGDLDIRYDRTRVLLAQDRVDEALELLNGMREIAETPEEQQGILIGLGKAAGQKGDTAGMIAYLEEALAIGGNENSDIEARYLLMNACIAEGDFKKLLENAEKIAEGDNRNEFVLSGKYYIAMAKRQLNDPSATAAYKEAISYYRSISLDNPSRTDAYLFRAMCLKDLNQYDKALELVDYVIKLQPENGQLHAVRGNLLRGAGRNAEADQEFRLAEQFGFDSPIGKEA